MYFVARYCKLLEDGCFRGRLADFLWMLTFGAGLMIVLCFYTEIFGKIKFLGHSLSFMMVYIWGRAPENQDIRMSLLGLITFNAPYLPWVLLLFSLFLGNPIETDMLGIVVGHLYYFGSSVYPRVARVRNWGIRQVIPTPFVLHYLCDSGQLSASSEPRVVDGGEVDGVVDGGEGHEQRD